MARRPSRAEVRRIESILHAFDVKALDAFLREPGAAEALSACDAVARTVNHRTSPEDVPPERTRLVFLRRLLAVTPDINLPSTDPEAHFATGFGSIVSGGAWLSEEAQSKLVQELLHRGDPNVASGAYRNGHGESALDLAAQSYPWRPKILREIAGKASRQAWLDALTLVLESADRVDTWKHILGRLTGDASGTDRAGLAPIHVAVVFCPPAVAKEILAASGDPAVRTTGTGEISVSECAPPGGGLVPRVPFEPGLTAIELLDRVLDFAVGAFAQHERKLTPDRREQRKADIERRRACRELLVAAGLVGRAVAPRIVPPWKREVDKLFLDLAEIADVDPKRVSADLERVHLGDDGPWGYFTAAVEALEDFFAEEAVLAWLTEGSLFRRLVTGDAFRGSDGRMLATELDPEEDHPLFRQVPVDEYPKEARAGIRQGDFIAADSDTDEIVFLWTGKPRKDGTTVTKVCRADLDRFEVLGPTVEAFLRTAMDRALGGR